MESTLSDEVLLARSRGGDRDARAAIYDRYAGRIYRTALRLLGNEADAADALQDVFLRLFGRLDRFRGDAAFSTWLYRLAVNVCWDLARRRSVRATTPTPPDLPAGTPEPLEVAAAREQEAQVRSALERLSPRLREVLVLRYFEGLDYEEIGRVLEIPPGTVRSRLSRAHRAAEVWL